MGLKKKTRRYSRLISQFSNWLSFLFFKAGKSESFNFKLRSGLEIDVKRNMLPPFKESFFDNVYLKELPASAAQMAKPIIIDIGGNVGFFSLNMFAQFPKARVHTFEPMPFNFNQLANCQKAYPEFNWKVYNKGIAEHEDGFSLFSSTVEGFSTMASIDPTEGKGKEIKVKTQKLESLIEEEQIKKIDLIKLDCEGSEYPILYNLPEEVLEMVRYMSIETHQSKTAGNSHAELKSFLEKKNWLTRATMNSDGTGYIWAWKD